ncbi:MAG: hypothetical protein AB8A46_01050 [Prochlorococcus sp.]|jgi:hypothetical protein|nr:hypothetical protein [Prochlorococcaceae cyanobacterium ETNP18_MAG_1]CAI8175755.1 MAG: Uncharacterised protein [Prochlorococcus marinus str. MIT 9215]
MLWLIGLVLLLQAIFHWLLEPIIVVSSPVFELSGFGWALLLLGAWLVAGQGESKGSG